MSVLAEFFPRGRLLSAGGRRSIENPSVPLNSEEAFDYLCDGSNRSDAGVSVTPRTALTLSAFWRGVSIVANAIAKTPLKIYHKVDDQTREEATDHPAWPLVHRLPCPSGLIHIVDFLQTAHSHVMFRGNSYAYIFRDGGGNPIELRMLDPNPSVTYPIRANGQLMYVTTLREADGTLGEIRRLPAADVLHVKGLGYDGLVGYDVITYACESLGLGLGLRKYGAIYFKNGAHLGVVLQHPKTMGEEAYARLKRDWAVSREGLDNAHKTVILEEDMKANVLGIDARKAQLIEMRQFETREIANFCGVPPYMLGDEHSEAFASLEQRSQDFLDHGVDIWFKKWEAECWAKLLSEEEKRADAHYFEFVREALISVDYKTQREGLATEVNNGLANLDEARKILNRPALPDGLGQKFRMPANHQLIDEPDDGDDGDDAQRPGPPAAGDEDEGDENDVRTLAGMMANEARRRVRRRIAHQAERAAKDPLTFVAWVESIDDQRAELVAELGPALGLARAAAGWEFESVEKYVEGMIRFLRGELLKVCECKPSELSARVKEWTEKPLEPFAS